MEVLITGITGFAGSHLAEYILNNHPECSVYGTKRYRSNMDNINDIPKGLQNKIHWFHDIDYTDAVAVNNLLKEILPERIFHLAAESFVPTSFVSAASVLNTNIQSQLNIFDSVVASSYMLRKCRIQIACSSEEYGLVHPEECPIDENNELRPLSPYAVSKISQDLMGYQYFKTHGLMVVRTRAFNHTGPRRGHVFVCSTFAKQIVEIELGYSDLLKVGNLKAVRDFTDVRDMVKAYWTALEDGEFGEVYNIGSGKGYSMKDVINILKNHSKVEIEFTSDLSRMRGSDVPRLICNSDKFRLDTGWELTIEFEDTMRDLLDYWRGKIRKNDTI